MISLITFAFAYGGFFKGKIDDNTVRMQLTMEDMKETILRIH